MPQQPDLDAIVKKYGGTVSRQTPAPVVAGVDLDALVQKYGGTVTKVAPAAAGPYDTIINRYAADYGVDPTLVKAVMKAESGSLGPTAVSSKGAQGLMQLMPATAKQYGVTDPKDPDQNIRAG